MGMGQLWCRTEGSGMARLTVLAGLTALIRSAYFNRGIREMTICLGSNRNRLSTSFAAAGRRAIKIIADWSRTSWLLSSLLTLEYFLARYFELSSFLGERWMRSSPASASDVHSP